MSSSDRTALREILRESLRDVLREVTLESQSFAPMQLSRTTTAGGYPVHRNPAAGFSSLPNSLMSSQNLSPLAQSIYLPRAPVAFNQNYACNREDTFISAPGVAERKRLLEQARTQILQNQILEDERRRRLFAQEQYMNILRNSKAKTAPDVQFGLGAILSSQFADAQSTTNYNSQKKSDALQALGGTLRGKDDPYVDVSTMQDPDPDDANLRRTRGGVSEPFPEKLHRMLEDIEKEGKSEIVSFYSHGRAFGVHDMDRFVNEVMPKYFKQTKWNSFARQLNLYGFVRISSGPDAGGYYHELFLKGRPTLSFHMRRVGVPQGGDRRKFKVKSSNVDPDFYAMKHVGS